MMRLVFEKHFSAKAKWNKWRQKKPWRAREIQLPRRGQTATLRASLMMESPTHPLNVESVAWISERKNVLSTLFGLLTLLAYTRYIQERTPPDTAGPPRKSRPGFFYILAVALFACSLMSKPMRVTLPCILLLLDHWPLNR